MQGDELSEHIFGTYISLRRGMAIICAAFPGLVYIAGRLDGVKLQDSLSAYYWASASGDYPARVWFVGGIFAIAAFLYLYKGFTRKENFALNAAALFGTGAASLPMEWNCTVECGRFSWHGASAVAMFICLAYVVFFRALDTLPYLPPGERHREGRFRKTYRSIGIVMALSPLSAFCATLLAGSHHAFIFFLEGAGIWAFAWYWWTKGRELSLSNVTKRALRAEVTID